METTKAVILAGGRGTRMRRHAHVPGTDAAQERAADSGVKGMIPVGRPFLDYVLSALADAGLCDVCIVASPDNKAIRSHYRSMEMRRVRLTFATQRAPIGTADALLAAESFADGQPAIVVNSDNYYPVHTLSALRKAAPAAVAVFEREALIRKSNIEAERVMRYALVLSDSNGTLKSIVEKPPASLIDAIGEHAFISMNSWCMPPEIYEACRHIEPSPRGELELQSAVQYARDVMGVQFSVLPFHDGVLDLSQRTDIPAVTAALRSVEPEL